MSDELWDLTTLTSYCVWDTNDWLKRRFQISAPPSRTWREMEIEIWAVPELSTQISYRILGPNTISCSWPECRWRQKILRKQTARIGSAWTRTTADPQEPREGVSLSSRLRVQQVQLWSIKGTGTVTCLAAIEPRQDHYSSSEDGEQVLKEEEFSNSEGPRAHLNALLQLNQAGWRYGCKTIPKNPVSKFWQRYPIIWIPLHSPTWEPGMFV
jgi:hypothetical protein